MFLLKFSLEKTVGKGEFESTCNLSFNFCIEMKCLVDF